MLSAFNSFIIKITCHEENSKDYFIIYFVSLVKNCNHKGLGIYYPKVSSRHQKKKRKVNNMPGRYNLWIHSRNSERLANEW